MLKIPKYPSKCDENSWKPASHSAFVTSNLNRSLDFSCSLKVSGLKPSVSASDKHQKKAEERLHLLERPDLKTLAPWLRPALSGLRF
jgi:hypothetical protein